MDTLEVTNLPAMYLRQLLEAVESGEVILTDFTVSSEVEEVVSGNPTRVKLTGEKNWYITTRPAPAPTPAPSEPPALVKWTPTLRDFTLAVDTLIADYQRGLLPYSRFFQSGVALGLKITKAANTQPFETLGYINLIRLAARLGRALNHG